MKSEDLNDYYITRTVIKLTSALEAIKTNDHVKCQLELEELIETLSNIDIKNGQDSKDNS